MRNGLHSHFKKLEAQQINIQRDKSLVSRAKNCHNYLSYGMTIDLNQL